MVADESLAYLQYRVIDSEGVEMLLHEESDMNSAQTKNKTRSERLLEDEPSQPQSDQAKQGEQSKPAAQSKKAKGKKQEKTDNQQ